MAITVRVHVVRYRVPLPFATPPFLGARPDRPKALAHHAPAEGHYRAPVTNIPPDLRTISRIVSTTTSAISPWACSNW